MSKVAIVMGSTSDLPVMQDAIDILESLGVETFVDIVSAHRTPEKLADFGKTAHTRGVSVIITGAGGAAYLVGPAEEALAIIEASSTIRRSHVSGRSWFL